MKAKITAPNGVTIELDDATAEDVERIAAIVQRDIKPVFSLSTLGTSCRRCHLPIGLGTGMCSGQCTVWFDPTATDFISEVQS